MTTRRELPSWARRPPPPSRARLWTYRVGFMLSRCGDVVLVLTAVGLVLALIRRHADVDWVGLAWFDGSAVLAAIVGDIVVWRLIGMWPRGFGARGLEIARRGTELFPDAFRIRRRRAR